MSGNANDADHEEMSGKRFGNANDAIMKKCLGSVPPVLNIFKGDR